MKFTETRVVEDLRQLNDAVRIGSSGMTRLADAISGLGYDIRTCVVVEAFPDSGNTWVVRLLSTDSMMVELDIDLDDSRQSKTEVSYPSGTGRRREQAALNAAKVLLEARVHAV